jgi:hypothetical protein
MVAMFRGSALAATLAWGLVALPVTAAEMIGQATEARKDVTGTLDALVRSIATGDGVSANEIVETGEGSATLITFLDDSSLNIGASSTVVLDSFVYNPERGADKAVLNLTKGAFRFVTGRSDPSKFVIQTQVATLGIRGTDFVKICPRPDLPVDCDEAFDLDRVSNAAIVGPNGDTTGAMSIPQGLVAAIIKAVAAGADGLTPTIIATGFHWPHQLPTTPRPISASPG